MTRTFSHVFTVEGRGAFPFDMLRYDCCWPLTGDDSANMSTRNGERRRVTLTRTSTFAWMPTEGRWDSFGWAVVPDSHEASRV